MQYLRNKELFGKRLPKFCVNPVRSYQIADIVLDELFGYLKADRGVKKIDQWLSNRWSAVLRTSFSQNLLY